MTWVVVDRARCASTGVCELEAPEIFEMGDDGAIGVLQPEPAPELLDAVEIAVRACPTGALSLVD